MAEAPVERRASNRVDFIDGPQQRNTPRFLRDSSPSRSRRDGRGLPSPGYEAQARGGDQSSPPLLSRRQGAPRALGARGAVARPRSTIPTSLPSMVSKKRMVNLSWCSSSSKDRRLRKGFSRDRFASKRPLPSPSRWPKLFLSARKGDHPSRSEAGECQSDAGRSSQSSRLRFGESARRRQRRRRGVERALAIAHALAAGDGGRRNSGDGRVHVTGAGEGQDRRSADGRLGLRGGFVRDADREASVSRRRRFGNTRRGSARRARLDCASSGNSVADPAFAAAVSRQGSKAPPRLDGRGPARHRRSPRKPGRSRFCCASCAPMDSSARGSFLFALGALFVWSLAPSEPPASRVVTRFPIVLPSVAPLPIPSRGVQRSRCPPTAITSFITPMTCSTCARWTARSQRRSGEPKGHETPSSHSTANGVGFVAKDLRHGDVYCD